MRYLIVDGHSVIFAWPELRKLHDARTARAREALIRTLEAYQDASGVHVVVVFDGKGAKPDDDSAPGSVQVFYSAAGQTADSVIERLSARYAGEHDITVATSDFMEQQTVSSFGAYTTDTDGLRVLVESAQTDLSREIRRHRRK